MMMVGLPQKPTGPRAQSGARNANPCLQLFPARPPELQDARCSMCRPLQPWPRYSANPIRQRLWQAMKARRRADWHTPTSHRAACCCCCHGGEVEPGSCGGGGGGGGRAALRHGAPGLQLLGAHGGLQLMEVQLLGGLCVCVFWGEGCRGLGSGRFRVGVQGWSLGSGFGLQPGL